VHDAECRRLLVYSLEPHASYLTHHADPRAFHAHQASHLFCSQAKRRYNLFRTNTHIIPVYFLLNIKRLGSGFAQGVNFSSESRQPHHTAKKDIIRFRLVLQHVSSGRWETGTPCEKGGTVRIGHLVSPNCFREDE
jgi:hypothetical protein